MSDLIESFGESVLQHGRSNDRVYLMKVKPGDCPSVVGYAVNLAIANNYSKVFAKAPASVREDFVQKSFVEEAHVPGLFNGQEDGCFLSKFLLTDRRIEQRPETVKKVLAAAESKFEENDPEAQLGPGLKWRIMQKQDVAEMSRLYKRVFASYPFPIDDPDYLAQTMDNHVIYHGVLNGKELVALSSAEIDFAARNVEMTDFATDPDHRGGGLATYLLNKMEADVRTRGIRTAYTIARAYSYGMNITFAKHGYRYAGTLTNNTQISGHLESMNIWYKQLD